MTHKRFLLIMICLLIVGFYYVHYQVHSYDERIITKIDNLDTSRWNKPRVAIVFGASVYSNGDLSPVLEDRVDTAIQLYRAHKVDRILVSGDNRHPSYNEPKTMREYILNHAVEPHDVVIDFSGRSTYETCVRARDVFGLRRVVLVSQGYHLPRALFIANRIGLDAVGMAGDLRLNQEIDYHSAREWAAEVKAYYNLNFKPPIVNVDERIPIN